MVLIDDLVEQVAGRESRIICLHGQLFTTTTSIRNNGGGGGIEKSLKLMGKFEILGFMMN